MSKWTIDITVWREGVDTDEDHSYEVSAETATQALIELMQSLTLEDDKHRLHTIRVHIGAPH